MPNYDKEYQEMLDRAHSAGMEKVREYYPEATEKTDRGGACGFAWIVVPGNGSFGRWLVKSGKGRRDTKGVHIWVDHFGQDDGLKDTYAQAFAASLRKEGLTASGQSRLD